MGAITQPIKPIVERISKYLDLAFPVFFFLLSSSFYLRTYDSAQVKITEVQMFGIILIALWVCKIFESGHWPFTKSQTLIVLPFILMFVSGVLSFATSPLPWGSFDFFIRRMIYVGIAMIAVTEITSVHDFRRITNWLILAVAVCTIYGLIQKIDFNFFPPGPPTAGLDKFVWRRAFGDRIFSTYGNPNFYSNFLVIMVPVMLGRYMITKQFYILPLVILTILNIYWTGSKGPAVGLMAGTGVLSFLLIRFFMKSRKAKMIIFSTFAVFALMLAYYIVDRVFIKGGITSFSFRMYTWLSTFEMIKANPVMGNGIGTFWVIYPAYRRPAIFHIEGKHNTETDHAENEHIEVWMDEGLIGMGFWIWMILMISIGIYKTLAILTAQPERAGPTKTPQKYPEDVYYMVGYVSGFLGMLIHNNTDVSMRFVSSGAPFWLLAGLNAALIMYAPLPEHQISSLGKNNGLTETSELKETIKKAMRVLVMIVIGLVAIRIVREFDWCQGRDGMRNPNELPHFAISWSVFLLCWGTATWWLVYLARNCTRIKSLVTILIAVIALVPFWGIFIGDVNHNRAIFFSKQGIWKRSPEFDSRLQGYPQEYLTMYSGGSNTTLEKNSGLGKIVNFIWPDVFWRKYGIGGALEHYEEVNRLRPDFIMAHYFRGNVYNDWGSQFAQKTYEAFNRGDLTQGEIFRKETDKMWSKAMDAYGDTRRLGPNYVQMHHQVGAVYQKWGEFFENLAPMADRYGHKDLGNEFRNRSKDYYYKALASYELYYKIDPVYDQNYYRQAQIYIKLGQLDKAEQVYLDSIEGKECKKSYHQIFGGFHVTPKVALALPMKEGDNFSPGNRYDLASPNHTHDIVSVARPEAWTYIGDFYAFVKKDLVKAEAAYKKAIERRPKNIDFWKRLANFYQFTNRVPDAIKTWQEVYKLNPNDPDVQRVMQKS